MLKDITIGQFFPGKSIVHRLDSRIKLLLTVLFIVMLFIADTFAGLAVGIVFLIFAYLVSGIPLKMIMKSVKPIVPLIIFTGILNLFFISTGDVLVHFWIFKITTGSIKTAIFMVVRIIALIVGTSLLTYTTSPIALTDAIERILSPLKKIKLPVHEVAMMMTIALRFIPTLVEETDKITLAQKARGADMETGSLLKRAKALVPVLIPLFVSAFRRAEELAIAMECRCYHGGEGRTRLKQLHMAPRDLFAVLICLAAVGAVIAADKVTGLFL